MKKLLLLFSAFFALSILTGCSPFTSTNYWNYQKITLMTQPKGANCTLLNNRGIWQIKKTPLTFTIHRSKAALQIFCYKRGYVGTTQLVNSFAPIMRKGALEPDYHPGDEDYNYFYPKVINIVLHSQAPIPDNVNHSAKH